MSENKTGGCIGALVLLLAAFVALPFQGWALWLMWNWFAVPLAPAITWRSAVGLVLLIGFLKMREMPPDDRQVQAKLVSMAMLQLAVLITVGLGWLVHALTGANP